MNRRFAILSIILIFTSACGSLNSPTTAPTIAATQPIPTATEIPPTIAPPTLPAALGTIALDFAALLCDAQWMNGGQHLTACPSATADHSGGYATVVDPASEGVPANTPVILTYAGTNSPALFLRYPSFAVHAGDRFRATLRCQVDAPCDVEYALEYYDANGKYHSPFISWAHRAGDPPINVDTDLSMLAGQTVDFVLTLRAQNDTPQQDYSLWIAPHIYRPNP